MGHDLNRNVNGGFVVFRDASSMGNTEKPPFEQLMISDLIIEKDLIPLLRQLPEKKE
jgi:hypothetical protein